jgi:hypothetical protein
MESPLHTIDVAHPPRHPDAVEHDILDGLAHVRRSNHLRQRSRCVTIIDGERYGLLDADTEALRAAAGRFPDQDLDAANPGITVVWVK